MSDDLVKELQEWSPHDHEFGIVEKAAERIIQLQDDLLETLKHATQLTKLLAAVEEGRSKAQSKLNKVTNTLEELSKQRHPAEMTDEEYENAAFEDAYSDMIAKIRATLNDMENQNEQ